MELAVAYRILAVFTFVISLTSSTVSAHSAPAARNRQQTVTFTRDIAPILFQTCASCHHAGDIGPFSLTSYDDAKKRAHQILEVTQNRSMPPWHAESHGEFVGERKLNTQQIAAIKRWAEAGAPEGDRADLPALPAFSADWAMGTPDAVFVPSKAYTISAEGRDEYRCFVMPTHFAEDRYISAMEIKPGNRAIVHHVVACLETSGKSRALEQADGGPGYTPHGNDINPAGAIGIYAPGSQPYRLPEGVGTLLPKGADIVLQVHYSKSGKQETDQTKIAFYFCKRPVDKRARFVLLFQPYLDIPAGDANYTLHSFPMPTIDDVTVLQIMPHMHLLGRTMTVTAKLPDKTEKVMIHVPNWDFHWQTVYTYKEPVRLPKHALLTMTATYDNSPKNARNPFSPPQRIKWGSLSTDEMCIVGMIYTSDSEHLTQGKTASGFYGFGRL